MLFPCQHLTLVLHFVCESREPRGARRGAPPSPKLPARAASPTEPEPVVGAVREPPVPPQRDSHPTATSTPRRPTHPPIVLPALPHRASFLRRQEPRGARRGAPPSPIASPTPPKWRFPTPFASLSLSKPVLRALEGGPPPPATPASPRPRRVVPTQSGTPPLAPGGTLTRPYCPHTGASATLSPWQSQSLTATRTSRVPMPSGARQPIRWWHGPHRWSEVARQASGGVVCTLQKNSWICS